MRTPSRTWTYAGFLVSLLFLLLFEPLIPTTGLLNNLIWEVAFLFVVVAALATASAARRTVVLLGAVGVVAEVLAGLSIALEPGVRLFVIAGAFRIVFLGGTAVLILRDLLLGNEVTTDKILGSVCVYLLIGMAFGFAFGMVGADAFEVPERLGAYMGSIREDQSLFFYFSVTTLTGLGYGDIVPVAPLARSLATTEAVLGQVYIAIIIAALVGIRLADRIRDPGGS